MCTGTTRPVRPAPPEPGTRDIEVYTDSLRSDKCPCGAGKQPKQSFCFGCYSSLPMEMKKALHLPFCKGYEQAFDRALTWLGIVY